jgi:hypothetical protein
MQQVHQIRFVVDDEEPRHLCHHPPPDAGMLGARTPARDFVLHCTAMCCTWLRLSHSEVGDTLVMNVHRLEGGNERVAVISCGVLPSYYDDVH